MIKNLKSKINIVNLITFLVCISIVFSFGTKALSEDNFNYAVEEMHYYDTTLYANNINIVGAEYSPRLIANAAMSLLMTICNGSWNTAAIYLIGLNYLLYSVAFTLIAIKLFDGNKKIIGVAIISIISMGRDVLLSLAFDINGAPDVFLGAAIPVALIALALVLGNKQNWNLAWFFAATAGLLHVHEGMWIGSVIGIIWIADCITQKKILIKQIKTLPVYVVSTVITVLPSLLNMEKIDESIFNEIYVFIRTPHHLLLSNWGLLKILFSGVMIAFAFIVLQYVFKDENTEAENKNRFLLLIIWWCVLLLVEYLATEVYAISFIITMYLPKCFKYITWIALLIYIKQGITDITSGRYIQGLSLLGIATISYSNGVYTYMLYLVFAGIYIVFNALQLDLKIFNKKGNETLLIVSFIIIFAALLFRVRVAGSKEVVVSALCFIIVFFIYFIKKYINVSMLSHTLVSLGFLFTISMALYGCCYSVNKKGITLISGDEYVRNAVGSDIYELAKEYESLTDKGDMFLADPDSIYSNGFQLVSRRSCYALMKNMPSDKNSVIEWYQRIENVRPMTTCSAKDLKDILNNVNVNYVLVTANRFSEIEESGLFASVVKNESYGVYKVK